MNNQMGLEIHIWAVPHENVQVQEMEPNASLLRDYGDGCGGGGGGGGDDDDDDDYHDGLDEPQVLD